MAPNLHAQAIGRAVHSAIREAGQNIKGTGEASGIPRRTMTRSINGERCFDFDDLAKVSKATGIPIAEMISRAERILDQKAAV